MCGPWIIGATEKHKLQTKLNSQTKTDEQNKNPTFRKFPIEIVIIGFYMIFVWEFEIGSLHKGNCQTLGCVGETCNCSAGGRGARCMCVSCLLDGREPVLPRSAARAAPVRSSAAGAAQCPDVPSTPVPTAQLPRPRLSFLGCGGGTLLRLILTFFQTK